MLDEQSISYLDYLRLQLAEYRRKRQKAAEMLAGDAEYRRLVLAGWDYDIGVVEQKIAREEQRAQTLQP